jgi:hypothetical protein
MAMSKKRGFGNGTIDQRGEDTWRLRQRYTVTFFGTKADARNELRRLIRTGDTGEHVAPDKVTLGEWIDRWLAVGAPGRSQKKAGRLTVERYSQLLLCHVAPALGDRRLQELTATAIDELYVDLAAKLKPRTAHDVHVVLGACLGTATRKALIAANPMLRVEQIPSVLILLAGVEEMPRSCIINGLNWQRITKATFDHKRQSGALSTIEKRKSAPSLTRNCSPGLGRARCQRGLLRLAALPSFQPSWLPGIARVQAVRAHRSRLRPSRRS